ncbi:MULTISPECIES: coiled-coil domain-containing protein [unclassified Endozoicomonas]|uniref:coiled-coil domain-containing protein n=1 Tax=unclassified Endozoicomonas TaxID=2644528 RepID=UPI003BB7DD73
MTAISNNRVDQIQKLPFAIKADIVNPEVGFLNGKQVTIQEINPEEFVGIQVSAGKFEELPKSIRPVKVAFKDFRQWLSNCRPVKGIKHLVMGKGKRMVKNQNWGEISPAQAQKALKATHSNDKKQILAEEIQKFNTDLKTLGQKKEDLNELKMQNDQFREKYKTILSIVDGDLTSLRNGSVIVLPPATEDGEPQLVALKSGSERVRKNAVRKLANIFMDSEAYDLFSRNVHQVSNIEKERNELKSSLAKQANNFKKEHKGLINERADDFKETLALHSKKMKDEAISDLKKAEVEYTETINKKIDNKISEANKLSNQIKENQTRIGEIQTVIAEKQQKLQGYEMSLMFVEESEVKLPEFAPKITTAENIKKINVGKTELLSELGAEQKKLENLQYALKKNQDDQIQVMKDLKTLQAEKKKEMTALQKARKKIENQYDDKTSEMSKLYDQDIKAQNQTVTKMFSGSGFKKKDTAQPQNDQENNPEA